DRERRAGGQAGAARGSRRRRRDPAGGAAAHLRALLPRGRRAQHTRQRQRAGARDREVDRPAARRHRERRVAAGRGHRVHDPAARPRPEEDRGHPGACQGRRRRRRAARDPAGLGAEALARRPASARAYASSTPAPATTSPTTRLPGASDRAAAASSAATTTTKPKPMLKTSYISASATPPADRIRSNTGGTSQAPRSSLTPRSEEHT